VDRKQVHNIHIQSDSQDGTEIISQQSETQQSIKTNAETTKAK